jgi:hypothetical protein
MYEENVDSEEAAGNKTRADVETQYRQYGHRPESVDIGAVMARGGGLFRRKSTVTGGLGHGWLLSVAQGVDQ